VTAHTFGPQENAKLPPGAMWAMHCSICNKRSYRSRKDARRAAKTFHPGESQRTYECPARAGMWHYGHRPDWVTQGKANPGHVEYILRRMRHRGTIPARAKEILMELDAEAVRVLRAVADAGQYDPARANDQVVSAGELERVAGLGLIERRRTAGGTDTGFYQLRAAGLHELENAGEKPVDTPPAGG
jgi:hypothetical protein